MRAAIALLACTSLLGGCASINVQQLDAAGNASGAPGLRYYMPRPYLLVTEVPAPPTSGDALPQQKQPVGVPPPNVNGDAHAADGQRVGAAKGDAKKDKADKADETDKADKTADGKGTDPSASTATTAASAGTDASYQHAFGTYQIKLVYLPDLSRPMVMTVSAGIGTVSMQPTLVDGWMLTSFQGSADSKVAETLTAVAQLVTAQLGPATAAAGTAGSSAKKSSDGKVGAAPAPLLGPGLYSLEYDANGIIAGVCAVTLFAGSLPDDQGSSGHVELCSKLRQSLVAVNRKP